MTTARCNCLQCGQKFEFPTEIVGQTWTCPSCGSRVLLKAAHQGPPAITGQQQANRIAMIFFVVLALIGLRTCQHEPKTAAQAAYDQTLWDVTHEDKAKDNAQKEVDKFLRGER